MSMLLLVLTACSVSQTEEVGVAIPMSGMFTAWGGQLVNGINDANTSVQFVFQDTQCEPAQAVTAMNFFIQQEIPIVIGPACGSPQEVIVPIVKESQILTLLPVAAAKSLHLDSDGWMYQMQYSLEDESASNAARMFADGHNRVGVVAYPNAFSQTHKRAFLDVFGGEDIVVIESTESANAVLDAVTQIKSAKLDALYVTDMTFFIANGLPKLREQGVDIPVYTQYAVEDPSMYTITEGVVYSFPEGIEAGTPAGYALANRAAVLVDQAVSHCGGTDAYCVKEYFEQANIFDANGIYNQEIIYKQIIDGAPVFLTV